MPKRLIILGSTGSIGRKALEVASDFPGEFEIVALSTNCQVGLLAEQAQRFRPKAVCVCAPQAQDAGRAAAEAAGAVFHGGEAGLTELVERYDADMVVVATVGFVGLVPTLRAIALGRTIALANKEVLVTAGELVMEAAKRQKARILPIDSEHNAIFQCLNGHGPRAVRRVILTASGGPFRGSNRERMAAITPDEALRHPTWNMGPKITIDSATLMNKGFEVIEGKYLFDLTADQIEVVVHPQSTIHSMVEYVDGSVIAQLGVTDMYLPIQNVLFYPARVENKFPSLDWAAVGSLTFERPDMEAFPCLKYAYEALQQGGTSPAVLNAANEVAVARFLKGDIAFLRIPEIIRETLDAHKRLEASNLEEIQGADSWARQQAAAI
ncbi:MAG: 1-deoxy-D-xylulose-5-phosphate reductoisomerase [Candidatus Sumerlaeaceae bacterium]|nr:1-deoxy-D-xylulose-5-phosphate reductoisomerase [Candidatus Sumerlaeaceae bacterium]